MDKEKSMQPSGWQVSLSIIMGVGWLIFLILWLAFYATGYSYEKNIAVILLSVLIFFLPLGGLWAYWAYKNNRGWEVFKIKGFKWRVVISIILPLALVFFLIFWFWYYATPYSIWQNLAVILVVILVLGGVLGSVWAHWGMSHSKDFEDYQCGEEKKE
jgi:hypothetical protein